MLRFLSAIGMSEYCQTRYMEDLVKKQLQDEACSLHTYLRQDAGTLQYELRRNMGPFALNLVGSKGTHDSLYGLFPLVRETRGNLYRDCEIHEEMPGYFYMSGFEKESGEEVKLMLTSGANLFEKGQLRIREDWRYSCYGLSVEGKILLGVERDEEERRAMEEEEAWRRDLLEKASQGDEAAIDEAEAFVESTEQEIRERMRYEDIYTILDGFFVQRGRTNSYSILGDIQYVDKMMNPETEEWVYRLQVKILGSTLGIYINPKDLIGQPAKGRRFQGEVMLQGMACPEQLLFDRDRGFF